MPNDDAFPDPRQGSPGTTRGKVARVGRVLAGEACVGSTLALDALVDVAVLVASADGRIDDDERRFLAEGISSFTGDGSTVHLLYDPLAESIRTLEARGVDAHAKATGEKLVERGIVEPAIKLGIAMAYANGGVTDEERAIVVAIADAAGARDRVASWVEETVRAIESA